MCFSATASFSASAILIPVGVYTLVRSYHGDKRYLALASFPLLFGLQQAVEGLEWLTIARGMQLETHITALGFLFFAYFLWPLLVLLSAYYLEAGAARRSFFLFLGMLGGLFGLSLYMPLLLNMNWLSVEIVRASILYQPTLIYDDIIPRTGIRIFYAAIVGIPLLLSSVAIVRIFGVLILLSVVSGFLFFEYAFTSIWCFIAAILSIYIVRIMLRLPVKTPS